MKNPNALNILTYIAKRGLNLTYYCECGDAIGKDTICRCGNNNADKKQAKKVKKNYLKNFVKYKNYMVKD